MGRKLTLDNTKEETITTALRHLGTRLAAASLAKVSEKTLQAWIDRGEVIKEKADEGEPPKTKDEKKLLQFYEAVMEAEAESENRLVSIVIRSAQGRAAKTDDKGAVVSPGVAPDWRAAIWLLERRCSKRWGYKQSLELTGKDGGPIETQGTLTATPEAAARLVREKFGEHARKAKDDDGSPGDTEPGSAG